MPFLGSKVTKLLCATLYYTHISYTKDGTHARGGGANLDEIYCIMQCISPPTRSACASNKFPEYVIKSEKL